MMTSRQFDTEDQICLMFILIKENEFEKVTRELQPICSSSNMLGLG